MAWLESESAEWTGAGLIDDEVRGRILGRYAVEDGEHRGMIAMIVLGALMLSIGVLLLIGYNWDRIPRDAKVAVILASVVAAFGGSAVAFAKRHDTLGDTLALIGTLLFGNAIWLVAQVLHIQVRFTDGFFWWAVGTLAAAVAVRSRGIGTGAAILLLVWVTVCLMDESRPLSGFAVLTAATLAAAYGLRSAQMIGATAIAIAAWLGISADRLPFLVSCGAAALTGGAFYAIGTAHPDADRIGRTWRLVGLGVLLCALVPLLTVGVHGGHEEGGATVTWAALLWALPSACVAATLGRRVLDAGRRSSGDIAILTSMFAVAAWLLGLRLGLGGHPSWAILAAGLFSAIALGLAVSLIHTALDTDDLIDLVSGVLSGLLLLVVRWTSLIDNMLWSGLLLISASLALFAVARLWRNRERQAPGGQAPVSGAAS